ncbi:hypothetical protein LTS10_004339 [Elasticomyces elasticus]|nr:hypothetical protein LTS10_004339 [Elasticomyces elasticus]
MSNTVQQPIEGKKKKIEGKVLQKLLDTHMNEYRCGDFKEDYAKIKGGTVSDYTDDKKPRWDMGLTNKLMGDRMDKYFESGTFSEDYAKAEGGVADDYKVGKPKAKEEWEESRGGKEDSDRNPEKINVTWG